jgi:cell division protein FtsZ
MYEKGIQGVDFIVCNTDSQALEKSPVPLKVQLGTTLTEGKGAGSIPEVGKNAAIENLDDIREILSKNTTMVFVTAGMGGGTGTGAAPVVAQLAREMGILTVGIVTVPFNFEGRKRKDQAEEGLRSMREAVDTLIVICNDKIRELYGNLSTRLAFSHADEVLCTAAKGIAEVITLTGEINVDMNDVKTVMKDSGKAIMGSGKASGENRAIRAVVSALESPLLSDDDITGAKFILLNITYGEAELLMDEISEITDHIQDAAGSNAEVIWGYGHDPNLNEDICVTIIATGFSQKRVDNSISESQDQPRKLNLEDSPVKPVISKLTSPTDIIPGMAPQQEEKTSETEPFLRSTEEASTLDLFSGNGNEPGKDKLGFNVLETTSDDEPSRRFNLDADELPTENEFIANSISIQNKNIIKPDEDRPSRDVVNDRNRQREKRLRDHTQMLKTPNGIAELESEPAFRRQGLILDNVPHSSETTISRLNLSIKEDSDGRPVLRPENPFMTDKPD